METEAEGISLRDPVAVGSMRGVHPWQEVGCRCSDRGVSLVSDRQLCRDRAGRRSTCVSGLVALIVGLGLIFAACGSSAGTATARATHPSPSCIPPALRLFGPQRLAPKELSTPLEATILSSFAIFRRPTLPDDDPPGLRRELYKDYELSSYYPAYVRQPTGLVARRYFVIPAFGQSEAVPPARCFRAGVRQELVEQERRRLVEPVYCIIEAGGSGQAPVPGCEPFAQVDESVRAFRVSDFLGGEPTIELVPDGVASVRVTYRETAPIIARVSENTFLLTRPPAPNTSLDTELRRLLNRLRGKHVSSAERRKITIEYNNAFTGTYPTRIEWLDSAGGLVRTLNPPTAESISATSAGNLLAPIEGSFTLKRSRSSHP